ncbi:hypothetical protein JFL43_10830 [Viridibacillus sp. YIM B01967]|uniref:Uncharacterized protein n=1 Tax=Viridibacillus soli TaxID=2798301 RepID=A0ABS1H7E5_9BACL|nr:hypothetical protein [Viridibacillus soli]MBK3495334.1 hypothetical protein [Viridibacillus soli]
MRKGKFFTAFLIVIFSLLSFNILGASAAENDGLTEEQMAHMRQLGFIEEIISKMTIDEYKEFENAIPTEPFKQETTVYKITSDSRGITEVNAYSEEVAEQLIKEEEVEESLIKPFTYDNNENSWLSMTTTSTKLGSGKTMLHNNFFWMTQPDIRLVDMVGLTYNSNVVIDPSTIKFSYKYSDKSGNTHSKSYKSIDRNVNGIAVLYDIIVKGYDHNGYVSVEVSKANSKDISANAFGHYTHTIFSFNMAVSIRSQDIALGLTTAEKKMTNTAIKFNF